jgi:hypothetical protein
MAKVVLRCTCQDGYQGWKDFEENSSVFNLQSQGITSVDLTPLSSCTSLQGLDLSSNWLENIELLPLSSCTHCSESIYSTTNSTE